jgi:predicted extracellular nuclease
MTLTRLVEAIAEAGGARYEWRSIDPVNNSDGGQPGANIRNAFLFNPDRVQFLDRGDCGADRVAGVTPGPVLNCSPGRVDPRNSAFNAGSDGRGGSRKPLAGEFLFNERRFFVVNLHLRSKGGDDPIFGRRQPRMTASTARRTSQAEVVAGFVEEILRLDADAGVVVLGDLNDFEDTDPLQALEAVGLQDLILRAPGEDRYTYVYTGLSQVLDHVLVSEALAEGAEVDAVHVNADFPAAIRASDHDPVIARITFQR